MQVKQKLLKIFAALRDTTGAAVQQSAMFLAHTWQRTRQGGNKILNS
jgi:hypothetical protein